MQPYLVSTPKPTGIRPNWSLGSYSTPFSHAEDAWFWALTALASRRNGERSGRGSTVIRPCEPDDIIKCVDQVYQQKRISLAHVRVLLKWGERRMTPDSRYSAEAGEAKLWGEALARLEWIMRGKGIVA